MSNTSKIILVTIVATAILLGLGYAAIQNITLNITGTASANVNQDNFDVSFVGTPVVSDSAIATAKITDEVNATIAVSGLTTAGQEVTATYDIANNSSDLSADLKVAATSSDTEYFFVSSKLAKSSLVAGESTTVLVTVRLTKTPIDGDVSTNIDIDLTAMPVQPGEEGTSEGTNDFVQVPDTTNEYGFYFDEAYVFQNIETGNEEKAVFHKDGSVEYYINDILYQFAPAGTAKYSVSKIDLTDLYGENGIVEISNNGLNMKMLGVTGILDKSFMEQFNNIDAQKNEYGFYYEQAYSTYVNGNQIATLVLHEDGSVEGYTDGILTYSYSEGNVTYTENKIDLGTDSIFVKCDGRLLDGESMSFGLDLDFWNRVINITFDEAYTCVWEDGIERAMVFHKDGNMEIYVDGTISAQSTESVAEYTNSKIIIEKWNMEIDVSEDGNQLIWNERIYELDLDFIS